MKYKKKPVIIEAIQFEDTAERICELSEFMGGAHVNYEDKNNPYVPIEISNFVAEKLNVSLKVIEDGGHLNSEFGYTDAKFLNTLLSTL